MSISQAVVSYSTPTPAFQVEEPSARPGNGPAFASAMAKDRPALPKPAPAEGRAAPPARSEEVGAPADPPDDPTTSPEGAASPGPDEVGPQEDDIGIDTEEALAETGLLSALYAFTVPQTRLSAWSLPSTQETADSSDLSDLPTIATFTAGPAVTVNSATGTSDISEAANSPVVEEPLVVSAAQLAFLQIKDTGTIDAEGPMDTEVPVIAGLAPAGLSLTVQASRAMAEYSLVPIVVRAAEQPTPADHEETTSDTAPEQPTVSRTTLLVQTVAAPTAPDAVETLTDLSEDTVAAGNPDSFILDGTVDVQPLTGGSHSSAILSSLAPASAPVVATPAQLAPIVMSAARQNGAADITVTLSPDELGTLHMRVSMEGDSLRITLLADRPETLDLLRRHGDQLLADLRNLGFGGATLGFGSSGGGTATQRFAEHREPSDALPGTMPPQQTSPAPSRMHRAGGIDIRL